MDRSAWRNAATGLLLLTSLLNAREALANWVITPDIRLRATYTDNRSLIGLPAEGGFATTISPGIRIAGGGRRFRGHLQYAPSAIFYSGSSRDDRFINTLSAFGNLEAIENFFFVDANGHISQTFISPFEPQPEDVTAITDNRIETRTFGVSPYVRGNVRGAFSYELRNRNTWTRADNRELADVQTTQWAGRVASPISLFGWALEYDETHIVYESVLGIRLVRDSRLYRGRLYFQPDSTLRLHVSGGREENNYSLQELRYYDIYGAGLSWRPGPRTAVELEWERRFFGPSRLARLTHRTRLTALSFSYSRNTGSFQQDLLTLPPGNTAALLDAIFAASIPDPLARQAAIDEFFRVTGTPAFLATPLSFYTQQVLLRERAEASAGMLGRRNSVIFTVFRSETTDLLGGLGAVGQDTFLFGDRVTQRGFGLRGNHQLTPQTTLGAGATRTFSRQQAPLSRDARNDHLTLSLNHTLSPKTTATAGLSFSHFKSNASSAGRDRRSVFVGLYHRF
jgi:uncharacterized protein (PEP-CTERM system associated)